MMRQIAFVLGTWLLISQMVVAQTQTITQNQLLMNEVNRNIWIPFVKGVNNNDPALYNFVNAKDFHWVSDGNKPHIMNLSEYVEDSRQVMNSRVSSGATTRIEVRFLSRNIHPEFASERCVVRYTITSPDGKAESSLRSMHVFSRRVDGVWKKLIQYALPGSISKQTFESAQPIE